MNSKELVAKIGDGMDSLKELDSKLRLKIAAAKSFVAKARQDYAKSENLISFLKDLITNEILNKRERIPTVSVTLWLLFLLIFFDMVIFFNLGLLPILIYYMVRVIKNTPGS